MTTGTFNDLRRAISDEKRPMPARVAGELHIYLTKHQYASISTYPPCEEDGDTPLFSTHVEFDVPAGVAQDLTEKQITSLERQKSLVMAHAHQEVRRLETAIQSLRAIEHKPEQE